MTGQPLIDISQLSSDVTSQLAPSLSGGSPGYVLVINSGGTATQWVVNNAAQIGGINVSVSSPVSGQVLSYNGSAWVAQTISGAGTVTSVAATGSTGLVVGGSPITSGGTLTFTLGTELQGLSTLATNGFVQRTGTGTYTAAALTSSQITTALGFTPGAGTVTSVAATGSTGLVVGGSPITSGGTLTFTLGTELQGLSAPTLTTTTGFVQRTGSGTYSVNTLTSSQVTAALGFTPISQNQAFAVTGDISGSYTAGSSTLALTLPTVNSTPGSYAGAWNATTITIPQFTVNAKGLVTASGTANLTRTIFTTSTQGEVPASGGGTTNFLRADGTWSVPAGSGTGTVTSVAATGSTGISVTGSPITTSGTLAFTLGTELQGLSGLGANGFVQRTGTGTYTAAALTSSQITTALTFTPVPNSTAINVSGGALAGGGPLTSSVTISLAAFNGTSPGYVPTNSSVTGTNYLRDDGTWDVPPGTVSSVNASGGTTGLTFSGGPITSSGTLTLSGTLAIANGGTGQTTASGAINALLPSQTGNSGDYLTTNGTAASWAALPANVSSFNTRTGAVTLQLSDVTTALGYTPLQNNQIVSLSGDATGSSPGGGSNTIPVTFATVNSNTGTFGSASQVGTFTVNGKGLITAASNVSITPSAIGAPTTTGSGASGTWAINITGNAATATTAANGGVTSIFGRTGAVTAATNDYTFSQIGGSITASQLPILSATGDATGTGTAGTGTIPLTLATSGVTAGSYTSANITVDAKGRVTAASNGSGSGVTSVTGGTGVTVSPTTGAVTVSIPQAVATSSSVQFGSFGVGTPASGTTGEIRATNNITAYYSSDINLKENVKPITHALEKVKQVRGVTFDWTDAFIEQHGGLDNYFLRKHDVGVIAQEVEPVLPEVVATRDDGIKAVKYDRIVALLIEAVKDLSQQVEELKRQVSGDE